MKRAPQDRLVCSKPVLLDLERPLEEGRGFLRPLGLESTLSEVRERVGNVLPTSHAGAETTWAGVEKERGRCHGGASARKQRGSREMRPRFFSLQGAFVEREPLDRLSKMVDNRNTTKQRRYFVLTKMGTNRDTERARVAEQRVPVRTAVKKKR